MKLFAYSDGSCGPRNPGGTAAYGFVIKNEEMEVIHTGSGRVCKGAEATNNVAEMEGMYQAMLLVAKEHPKANVEFNADSSLVIALMRGEAKARSGKYLPYYAKSIALAEPFIEKKLWKFRWIQRGFNSEADELAQYHRY